MYISRIRLKQLVEDMQLRGKMSDELATILTKIISGLAARQRFECDLDDRINDFLILVFEKINKLDASQNIFSYLTTMAYNVLRKSYRDMQNAERLRQKYETHIIQKNKF